ncbi:MAG: SgcJ/EcaC family oxidoreductase [Gammaproteobacteria bacterium]|nr:MAG: SgcJ/EcaC family oxidoreductase [Gammaproteobacteria bacterium]
MIAMRKAAGLSFLLVAFEFFAADALAADPAAEVKALQAVDHTWVKAYNAGDAPAAASLYDENAILMPPGAQSVRGRAAIRAFLASDMAASAKAGVTFHLGEKSDGGVTGAMGWVSGTYSVTDKSGKVVETGKYLSVSKKENGKWLYVRDTWNSDGAH